MWKSAEITKPASLVTTIVFWLMALAQLRRVLFRVEVQILLDDPAGHLIELFEPPRK